MNETTVVLYNEKTNKFSLRSWDSPDFMIAHELEYTWPLQFIGYFSQEGGI